MREEWKRVDALAGALGDHFGDPPDAVVVLGSGLGKVADSLDDKQSVLSADLPGYPESTVSGHQGRAHMGTLGGTRVMIYQGRVHLYEGCRPEEVVRPLRAAVAFGAKTAVLTNAAGGIDPALPAGSLMIIDDHLNLTGRSVLLGPNDDARGPRFPDMSEVYGADLRRGLDACARRLGIRVGHGVYAGLLGPTYETPAEVRMLAALGASAVGMSTVQEAIALRHMGARIAAVSCITNPAAGISKTPLNHEEVEAAGLAASEELVKLLVALLEDLS
jgi:purine-nucleoside phosphorylase